MTDKEGEAFTSKEVRKSLDAKAFLLKAGYPSPKEANYAHGTMVGSVRGKTTKQRITVTKSNAEIVEQLRMQILTSDAMFAGEEMLLS